VVKSEAENIIRYYSMKEKRLRNVLNNTRVQLSRIKTKLRRMESTCSCQASRRRKNKCSELNKKQEELQTLSSLRQIIINSQANTETRCKKGFRWEQSN
jgi:hypothetical protein